MVPNNKDNITIGLPKANGAVFWAPAGTTLPADADTALSSDFINLGFITDDGLTATISEEGDDIVAWGRDKVARSQTSYSKNYTFNLLETSRESALQFVYGIDNVTVGVDGEIEIDETGDPLPRGILVCDTIQNNGGATPRIKRQIAGDAQFIDRSGDNVHNNSDAVAFPVSVEAYKFPVAGKSMYTKTYISKLPVTPTP